MKSPRSWFRLSSVARLDPAFENNFRFELIKSELLRVNLLIVLIPVGFTMGFSILYLVRESIAYDLVISHIAVLAPFLALMLVYELVSRWYIRKQLSKRGPLSQIFMIINILVENSFPTVIVAAIVLDSGSVIAYFSPFMFLYFLFVILAILHLDFWFSVFSGATAALQYVIASQLIIRFAQIPEDMKPMVDSYTFILARAMLIFLSGVASGFVAQEIKRGLFKTMRATGDRNRIRQILGQQVSHEIVDQIINAGKEIETQRLNVCVMFLDVRDFTPFASQHTPEEVLDYQNKLFGNLIDIVNRYQGIINQILGDGFMATFGAPISHGNDCSNAVNAALEILEWTQKACNDGLIHPTRLGIGIHYGEAITGNIGTELRKQFSIVGNVVIRASRIEQLNKEFKSQLLISKEVFEKINTTEKIQGQSLGDVVLKGENEPLEIIRIK